LSRHRLGDIRLDLGRRERRGPDDLQVRLARRQETGYLAGVRPARIQAGVLLFLGLGVLEDILRHVPHQVMERVSGVGRDLGKPKDAVRFPGGLFGILAARHISVRQEGFHGRADHL